MTDLVERLESEREEAKDRSRVGAPWDPGTAQRVANTMFEAAAEIARLRADNAFLHQRRGELVIERDNAIAQLMEWTKGDGPNQQLLEQTSNSAMKAAIAETECERLRAANRALEGALDKFWEQDIGADRIAGQIVRFCERCEAEGGAVYTGAAISWRDVPHTATCAYQCALARAVEAAHENRL